MNDDRPVVARTRAELAATMPDGESLTAVVMTMGALHDGHRALIDAARKRVAPGPITVTIFVNPLQFGPGEDFKRYPRSFQADVSICRHEGVDVVFAPDVAEMYPGGEPEITVDPGPLGAELEGAFRRGHFAGVLTVVAKLLNLTVPTYAFFGEKDYQQLVLVRRMVEDLDMGHRIVGVPTVREPDGLALSSRNRYLSAEARQVALALSRALLAGVEAAQEGREAVLAAGLRVLEQQPALDIDYFVLRDPELRAAPSSGDARLLVAARVGGTRLIDNMPLTLG